MNAIIPNVQLAIAQGDLRQWARASLVASHYLHTAPDPRTRSIYYAVTIGPHIVGCMSFGRPESTRCYEGGLTYGSQEDVEKKRAQFDRWEILNLSRVWFLPSVQPGGAQHRQDFLPGFIDRKGAFRSTLASLAILEALKRIGRDYLLAHPPCFIEQPYQIRAVLSYCDTRLHRGTIYKAAHFKLARTNKVGIETWWTQEVRTLTRGEDRRVRGFILDRCASGSKRRARRA